MADSSLGWFIVLGLGTVGLAYAFVPEFRKQVNGVFGAFGGGGAPTKENCADLCAKRNCAVFKQQCSGTCKNCDCAKMCGAAQCGTLRSACPGYHCQNCVGVGDVRVSANCRYVTDPKNGAKYTIWKGTGCSGGYLRNNLEAAVSGNNCTAARAAFVKAYACPSKYAHAYSTFETVTVA